MKSKKYKEIFKLKKMLEDAEIPFSWIENWDYDEEKLKNFKKIAPDLIEHYQICYPVFDPDHRWISVIEGFGTYGAEQDRLEIMGGFTPWEMYEQDLNEGSVMGYLTANNVFNRIKKNWEERKDER